VTSRATASCEGLVDRLERGDTTGVPIEGSGMEIDQSKLGLAVIISSLIAGLSGYIGGKRDKEIGFAAIAWAAVTVVVLAFSASSILARFRRPLNPTPGVGPSRPWPSCSAPWVSPL
jgi:hypothetical protein